VLSEVAKCTMIMQGCRPKTGILPGITTGIAFLAILAISGYDYRDMKVYQRRAWCALDMQPRGTSLRGPAPPQASVSGARPTTHFDSLKQLDRLIRRLEYVMALSAVGCLFSLAIVIHSAATSGKPDRQQAPCSRPPTVGG